MAVCLVLLTFLEPPSFPWGGSDYAQYHVAWELLFSGKNPYDHELAGQKQVEYGIDPPMRMYGPAWSMLPSLPLVGLAYRHAVIVHIVMNVLLLIFAAVCWMKLLFPNQRSYLPLAIITLPLWLPCVSLIGIGQISAWPLVGFTGWLFCMTRQRPWWAGIFLALTIIKPHLGLLPGVFAGVYLLRHLQWKTILAFLLAVLAPTLFMVWLRPTIWSDYVQALNSGVSPTEIRTATFDGWARQLCGQDVRYFTWSLWAVALVLAGLTGWKCPRLPQHRAGALSRSPEEETLVTWSALVCLASIAVVPYAFSMDYVFMLPGFFLALGIWLRRDQYWQLAILGWLALELCLVTGVLQQWGEYQYWFIPWMGLLLTMILLRQRSLDAARLPRN